MSMTLGDGLNKLLNGVARAPALAASLTAARALQELAFRGCRVGVSLLTAQKIPDNYDSPWLKEVERLTGVELRFQEKQATEDVAFTAVKAVIAAAFLFEITNILAGTPPAFYNKAFAFLRVPVRIHGDFLTPFGEKVHTSLYSAASKFFN